MKERKLNALHELLLRGSKDQIQEAIDSIHPADNLEVIHDDPDHTKLILEKLDDDTIADIIEEEDDEDDQYELLKQVLKDRQRGVLDEMSDDEIADIAGELEPDEKKELLSQLDIDDKENVENLLNYDPETAGGLMTTDFISIHANNTVLDTFNYLHTAVDEDTPKYYLYVVDQHNVLKGVVDLRTIVASPFDTPIMDITNTHVKTINYKVDQEDAANVFKKYNYVMMPVVDDDMHMLGVIEIDDIMDVIEDEATEDMNLMGGTSSEERADNTIGESFKSRIPWLIVNLITAVMAAAVVAQFEGTIEKVVSLSAIMSIVTGMGGNAGTQSLTVLVRGLSLGEVERDNAMKIFLKEVAVGVLSGIVIGILVAIGSTFYAHGNPWFGVVAFFAMLLNMICANIAGFVVPVVLKKCHADPALASGVFVTTVTDCMGFFFFLGLATLFLPHLL